MEEVAGGWAMKLGVFTATMRYGGTSIIGTPYESVINAAGISETTCRYNVPGDNLGVVGSYQKLYEGSESDILCFIHDDVWMYDTEWPSKVKKEFEDPTVGVVGFGGAKAHGSPDLYKVPYRLNDLARYGYLSNVDDAEVHGERFSETTDVAVLDGFALCIRRVFLARIGGFSSLVGKYDYFNYDYAICALARRHGLRVRLVGVRCHHLGGRTSTGNNVGSFTGQDAYDRAHRLYYDEFKDVMPCRVKEVG
jgi:GT2 family glycosyltransferase